MAQAVPTINSLADEIKAALLEKLPPELHTLVPDLSDQLAQVVTGTLKPDDARDSLNNPNFTPALQALAGTPIKAGGIQIAFGGDKIIVGDINQSKATAVGTGAKVDFTEINLAVSGARVLPAWQRKLGYFIGGVLLIGAVLIIYQFAQPYLTPPLPMGGNFNVAVARFRQELDDGRVTGSEPADRMARAVYSTLTNELAPLQANLGIETRSPEQTGAIAGDTPQKRAESAAQLAAQINADVVFYATLDSTGTIVTPEFYLSSRKLEKAEEAAGVYLFGQPLMSDGNIAENPAANLEMTHKMATRTNALAQFVFGLSSFALGRYDDAAGYFATAAEADTWEQGVELLYLFQGNTAGKLDNFDQARAYYDQALANDPEYARARLGLAAVRLQQSKGSCEQGSVDIAGLEETIRLYQWALEANTQPALADIQTKANAGMGQTYLCLTQALAGDYSMEARRAFEAVIADYENGNERVRQLAAESYANLGFLSLPYAGEHGSEADNQYRAAAEHYRKAIELSRDRKLLACSYRMLGFIHARLGEYAAADEAYRNAIQFAPDDATRAAYEMLRQELQQAQTETVRPEGVPTQ